MDENSLYFDKKIAGMCDFYKCNGNLIASVKFKWYIYRLEHAELSVCTSCNDTFKVF